MGDQGKREEKSRGTGNEESPETRFGSVGGKRAGL